MNSAATTLEPYRPRRAGYASWILGPWLVATMLPAAGCVDVRDLPVVVISCGDGALDEPAGEQCDHGGPSSTCDHDCTLVVCGDGVHNPLAGEECDDAGESGRCNADCTWARCGDGKHNMAAGEWCDDADPLRCDSDCTRLECGDGVLHQAAGEVCDDGNDIASDACTSLCQPARCGDGFVYPDAEECDDGNDDHTDFCTATCEVADCSDGLHNGAEADLDCGGPCAQSCRTGQTCSADHDCFSGTCSGGACVSTRLALGSAYTCVLREDRTVRCWGWNASDIEGDGIVQLAAGYWHTCALLEDGTVQCRGAEAADAALALDLGRVVQIAAGYAYTCAILETGLVRCWGDGPVHEGMDVGGRAVQIAVGAGHACALLERGAMRCWGDGDEGQLGYGEEHGWLTLEDVASAGDVSTGGRVLQIAAGRRHTCALYDDGRVRCWGDNGRGQLGYGQYMDIDEEPPSRIADVDLGGRAVQITADEMHTCALLDDGAIRCWGRNDDGRLGYGHTRDIGNDETPGSVDAVEVGGRAVQVAAGGDHTCALLEDGNLRCWGANDYGQLGDDGWTPIGDDELPSSVSPIPYR